MYHKGPGPTFVSKVQDVLQNFYNPSELLKSPLIGLFSLEKEREPAGALRRIFREAIRTLKTEDNAPRHSTAWRVYYVLNSRFVEQLSQKEVADELALSTRQIRRYEHEAAELLANAIWNKLPAQRQSSYRENEDVNPQLQISSPETRSEGVVESRSGEHEQELFWLKSSMPIETTSVATVIGVALKTAAPLIHSFNVEIRYDAPDHFPPLIGQVNSIKQALLELLTGVVRFSPRGKVNIRATEDLGKIRIQVNAWSQEQSQIHPRDLSAKMHLISQLADISGGELEYTEPEHASRDFSASLLFPAMEQIDVLAIDDNEDTLQLYQRFLAGTQYRLSIQREPTTVINRLEEIRPEVVLLDVMMPGIDGWELLGQLREHPKLKKIPIIISTILFQEDLALSLGAACFLRKPFTREALLTTLAQALTN